MLGVTLESTTKFYDQRLYLPRFAGKDIGPLWPADKNKIKPRVTPAALQGAGTINGRTLPMDAGVELC